jgi:hypothetical protein
MKPNGIVMGEAILAEWRDAQKEKRAPSTSNALALFTKSPNAKRLTPEQTHELFNFVFKETCKITGWKSKFKPSPN